MAAARARRTTATAPIPEKRARRQAGGLCREFEMSPRRGAILVPAAHTGVLTGWVADIPLPGSERQPGRPVQPRAGGLRRSQNQQQSSLSHPDDGPRSTGPQLEAGAWHAKKTENKRLVACVPSADVAGHACGPRARAERSNRPRIIDTLTCAREWRRLIDTGKVKNAAELAGRHGVTRARVSQIMSLLRLAPEILAYIDRLDGNEGGLHLTERRLRDIAVLDDQDAQRARFWELVGGAVVE